MKIYKKILQENKLFFFNYNHNSFFEGTYRLLAILISPIFLKINPNFISICSLLLGFIGLFLSFFLSLDINLVIIFFLLSFILDENIITNVALEIDKKKINYKKLNFAISQANLDKVIDNLPNKIETKIGDNGIRLSGGQNKRLALSRTFYHGKKIIVIDEATSALDFETESYIAEEIKRIKGKSTIVIISHNKNILKYCDSIYSIQNKTIKLLKENENI